MDNSILRRKDTTKGPPLRILSLDGGGVRGYSMLILLQELMYRTYVECEGKAPKREEIPKPCDHFDLIAGTGTGGLIALMLGRMRMDVETCKDVYVRMTRRVFETDKTFAGIPYRSTLFKASKLEDAIRSCVREHTLDESEGNDGTGVGGGRDPYRYTGSSAASSVNGGLRRHSSRGSVSTVGGASTVSSPRNSLLINGLMWGNPNAVLYDHREHRTKTAVTAVYKGTPRNGSSTLLRSYDSRREPPPEFNCTIWQAGRATCATGLAFKPIQIGQNVFIDEGAGKYNPGPQILDEAAVNEWPGRELGVFVSIGTGKRPAGTNSQQHEWWEDFFGDALGNFAEARRRLISKIEGCEDTHQYMLKEHLRKRNVNSENYYRLNVEVGVGEFGMNEWSRLADISTSTRRYLGKPEVQVMNLDAASKLAKIQRAHRRIEAHAAGLAEDEDNGFGPPRKASSNHRPTQSWSPSPLAVELPAEDVVTPPPPQHGPPPPPSRPSIQLSPSSQDKFTIMAPDVVPRPTSSGNTSTTAPGRRSGSDVAPSYRTSYEQQFRSDGQTSPRRSADNPYGRATPPPLPPKTPIPYPDDDRGNSAAGGVGGGIPMPEPLRTTKVNGHGSSDASHLPYPDTDGPPPVVNKQRKPTYNVR
ncbi:hypothetical protein FQN54_000878 [Arachnomyces sp. PD_36]|nr:hypothetical protein FQN54_000878 [Arachnomyces sp. PD_36]